MTSVFDLRTATYTDYTLSPREAVIAAYAQREKRDFNTWLYGDTYGHLVTIADSSKPGLVCVSCGNQSCLAFRGKVDQDCIDVIATDTIPMEARR